MDGNGTDGITRMSGRREKETFLGGFQEKVIAAQINQPLHHGYHTKNVWSFLINYCPPSLARTGDPLLRIGRHFSW